jgi:hypothetical protein
VARGEIIKPQNVQIVSQHPIHFIARFFNLSQVLTSTWCGSVEGVGDTRKAPVTSGRNESVATSYNPLTGKLNLRFELAKFDSMIGELKTQFEQYFVGLTPHPPDKLLRDTYRLLRQLRKAPFKTAELSHRLLTLEHRLKTYHTHWQRVMREKENGTYFRDVFKANLRERRVAEDVYSRSEKGKSDRQMQQLFQCYKGALEKVSGKNADIDYQAFQRNLLQRAKDFREQHTDKKLSFRVVVKKGQVLLQARIR